MKQPALLPRKSRFMKRIHVSWLLAGFSGGILAGIAFAPQFEQAFVGEEWLIVAIVVLFPVLVRRRVWLLIAAICSGMLIGLWRGSAEELALRDYQQYYGQQVRIQGLVSEDTSYGKKGDQRMRLRNVSINNSDLSGTVWVSMNSTHDIKRGDVVTVRGLLAEGFGNIPAAIFRAEVEGIKRPVPGDIGRQVRDWFSEGVYNALPRDEAGLALGYLVGQKQTLPEEVGVQFQTVGLIHAVVASGFHLTVLVGLVRRLFGGLSKYLSTLTGFAMIFGFIGITGMSPSMSRAGLISGLSLLAWYYGRSVHPMVLLPFAAAVTAMFNPSYIWGDIGWYLSFSAFAGVIILAPLLNEYFWGKKQPGYIRTLLVATLAAQIATLPLIIFTFGYYSIYALPANLLVVPLVSLTMLLTFVSGVIGLIWPAIASPVSQPLVLILDYMIRVVDWLASLPNAKTEVTFSATSMVTAYVVLIVFSMTLWLKTKYNFRNTKELI